jgi:hypothetical protein
MAYGIIFDIPGMTREQYERLTPILNAAAKSAPGFLAHISGPTETGYRIVEAWQSEEAQQRFVMEQVVSIFQREGIPPARTETFIVENVVTS